MAYKKLIKVSNVCQLLDKRKYFPTQTINGVTFTNNGNGTITVNGTATGRTVFRFVFDRVIISKGAKLRFNNALDVEAYNKFWVEVKLQYTDGTDKYIADVSITPSPPIKDVNEITGYIIVNDGETVNETLTPQLFDLTEMYGAGHEPTTVEQFRQDFPDEMYDYSPYCWLTSYKRVFMTGGGNYLTSYQRNLTCKTKNLFDINRLKGINYLDVYGNSLKCFKYATSVYDISVLNIFKSIKPNTIYTMSATVNKYITGADGRITLVFSNGSTLILFNINQPGYRYRKFSLTQEQIDRISSLIFYGEDESAGGPIIWDSIQLELGDTATDYVPYGHL